MACLLDCCGISVKTMVEHLNNHSISTRVIKADELSELKFHEPAIIHTKKWQSKNRSDDHFIVAVPVENDRLDLWDGNGVTNVSSLAAVADACSGVIVLTSRSGRPKLRHVHLPRNERMGIVFTALAAASLFFCFRSVSIK